MKKVTSVFSILILLAILVISTVSFAVNGSISPMYVASCPLYDKHHMQPSGTGMLFDTNGNHLWDGQTYQCDCGHFIVIKDGHMPGQIIGYYYRGNGGPLNTLTVFYDVNPSDIEYTPYNYLPGYEFY